MIVYLKSINRKADLLIKEDPFYRTAKKDYVVGMMVNERVETKFPFRFNQEFKNNRDNGTLSYDHTYEIDHHADLILLNDPKLVREDVKKTLIKLRNSELAI